MLRKILDSRMVSWLRARPRLIAGAAIALVAGAALGAGLAVGGWQNVCDDCPSIAQLYAWEPPRATKILSHDGRLIAELFQQRRTPVSIEDLPPYVHQAFVAVEDKRFYRHGGFDLLGIARAFVGLVTTGDIRGGGSTITQQLARNMFVEQIGYEQRFVRKLKELKVALEIEDVYAKEQVLEAYINQINYGSGWYGIETAAQRYFGKHATELNPAEAALLAAVINKPGYYSPFENPDAARRRRNLVLALMARQGYLAPEEAERWKQEPLPEQPSEPGAADLAPYFVEMVREQLDDRFGARLYTAGYRVVTTLDLEMQKRAQEAMRNGWTRIEKQPGYRHPEYEAGAGHKGSATPYLQGLFIAADPQTGAIRALIGGRDFRDSKFNRATQARRQPGSVFKPFVYTAAIASGIPASHVVFDAPIMLEQVDGTVWSPKNYDGDFEGPMTLRQALKTSVNTIAVKVGMEVGIETVSQYARKMGIETPIPPYPSTAIGAADVIPMQVVEAYSVFATDGVRARPFGILRIEDAQGRVIWQARPDTTRVLDPQVTTVVRSMMRDVVDHGSGYPVRDPARGALPYAVPAGGKTGTTNDATNVWFVGFTPDLIAAVWFGFDTPKTILPGAAGGVYAAPVWGQFMRSVYVPSGKDTTAVRPVPAEWAAPPELTTRQVDRQSGKIATEWCPLEETYSEIFIPGTEPTETCDLHAPGLRGGSIRAPFPDDTIIDW